VRTAGAPPQLTASIKCGFQPTQAMQGTQHTQEVAENMAGICHLIWLASNERRVLDLALLPLFTLRTAPYVDTHTWTYGAIYRHTLTHVDYVAVHPCACINVPCCMQCKRGLSRCMSTQDTVDSNYMLLTVIWLLSLCAQLHCCPLPDTTHAACCVRLRTSTTMQCA